MLLQISMKGTSCFRSLLRPTLKSCLFPIHRPGEINCQEVPAGRNFSLKSLCLKRYKIKRFMLIYHNLIMIDINQSPVLCPHTYKTNYQLNILTNIQANSLLCRPTLIHYLLQSRLIKKRQ